MNIILKKTVAIFFLAIYAINPLHSLFCCDHNHDNHHEECSAHDCSPDKQIKENLNPDSSHECFVCQNSKDRMVLVFNDDSPNTKDLTGTQSFLVTHNTHILSKNIFFIDLRGPPTHT